MLYLYHEDASQTQLALEGDSHRYIFKVRRHKVGDTLHLRNLVDDFLYTYAIDALDKRSVYLTLKKKQKLEVKAAASLHIGWCIIDPRSVEKVLPTLNEMGVDKVTFFYCKRSQKSFKLDFNRLEKILLGSSQQCGRSKLMKLELMEDLELFLKEYPDAKMLNFSENSLSKNSNVHTIVIGCEGGFHEDEVACFNAQDIWGLETPLVLKSESAACAVSTKLLL